MATVIAKVKRNLKMAICKPCFSDFMQEENRRRRERHNAPAILYSISDESLFEDDHRQSITAPPAASTPSLQLTYLDEFDDTVLEAELVELMNGDTDSLPSYREIIRIDLVPIDLDVICEVENIVDKYVEKFGDHIPFTLLCERLEYKKRQQKIRILTQKLFHGTVQDSEDYEWQLHPKDRKRYVLGSDPVDADDDDGEKTDENNNSKTDDFDDDDFSMLIRYSE